MTSGATLTEPEIHLQRLHSHRSGPGQRRILATILQQQFVHEGRQAPSQGWYTGSTPVRAATYETAFLIGKIAKKWSDESDMMKC
jgi:hypothetical protein